MKIEAVAKWILTGIEASSTHSTVVREFTVEFNLSTPAPEDHAPE